MSSKEQLKKSFENENKNVYSFIWWGKKNWTNQKRDEKKINIILLDDNKSFTDILWRKISKEWFNVICFNSIWDFDFELNVWLYIIDLKLEKFTFDLIKKLRSRTDKPIMILSWYSNQDFKIKSFESWADCYSNKLSSPKIILAKIKSLIRMYHRIKYNK